MCSRQLYTIYWVSVFTHVDVFSSIIYNILSKCIYTRRCCSRQLYPIYCQLYTIYWVSVFTHVDVFSSIIYNILSKCIYTRRCVLVNYIQYIESCVFTHVYLHTSMCSRQLYTIYWVSVFTHVDVFSSIIYNILSKCIYTRRCVLVNYIQYIE